MTPTSAAWFAFLAAVYLVYWPLARFRTLAVGVILLANWLLYARWDLRYLALIPAASLADYAIAHALDRASGPFLRRLLVSASLAINLGLIVSLKYTGWVLPLSLSFYAFQSLTGTLDVYRRDARPASSLLAHLAAVSFFPTTLSGPITRVSTLAGQLEAPAKPLAADDGGRALFLIGLGLLKKLAIADYLAANLVDRVFDFPNLYTAAETAIAVVAYAFQLYYDFSGYTDIAIGSALLLGLNLPRNFRQPYLAESLPDFWRRWHITFSNWLRDYLYFSLPGLRSRHRIIPALNLLITMILGGLWHGAGWNFLIWGLLHGVALTAARLWGNTRTAEPAPRPCALLRGRGGRRAANTLLTFLYVCFAWIFFRAPDPESAWAILARLASFTFSLANISGTLALVLVIAAAGHAVPSKWYDRGLNFYAARPFYVQGAALAALVLSLQYVASTAAAPFIYTRF